MFLCCVESLSHAIPTLHIYNVIIEINDPLLQCRSVGFASQE